MNSPTMRRAKLHGLQRWRMFLLKARHFAVLALAVSAAILEPVSLKAQNPGLDALTGQISSQEEAPMEGVVVSAKGAGTNITISVVSDNNGRYRFPRTRLKPNK